MSLVVNDCSVWERISIEEWRKVNVRVQPNQCCHDDYGEGTERLFYLVLPVVYCSLWYTHTLFFSQQAQAQFCSNSCFGMESAAIFTGFVCSHRTNVFIFHSNRAIIVSRLILYPNDKVFICLRVWSALHITMRERLTTTSGHSLTIASWVGRSPWPCVCVRACVYPQRTMWWQSYMVL